MRLEVVPRRCYRGHAEVLHWAHENGCPWMAHTPRDRAVEKLGYTDALGNPVDEDDSPVHE